ncbi:hypothetical protein [Candidatus Nitrosotenuis uzonensis]|uniref:Tetratricopeptide repeat protein n=1 Tax=Candidatus Nitrosotenuis uzonensis TaxID=1407055 RepID=V6ARW7_9ARCH|nr:hypothetical protein [Candidatus Nitrosotenuis uzonensis]CDI05314.1 hypothetical protein NITUZ_30006 [Candidatus Nitrosotenuis uzonensis]
MLSLEKIREIEDPYQSFLDSLVNNDNKRKYPKQLFKFLQLIPHELFLENGISTSDCNNTRFLANCFVALAKKDPSLAKNIGEAECMLGFKEAGQRYFTKAEENSMNLTDQATRANVLINLATACMKMKEYKMERNYLMKALQTTPETEKILEINKRLSELSRYC